LWALLAVPALLVGACGDGGGGVAADGHNHSDVTFLQGMVQHHEQVLRMSDSVAPRVVHPYLADLARFPREELAPGIETMKQWLERWGHPMRPESGEHSGGHGVAGLGMPSDVEVARLDTAPAPALEKLFLEAMIRHYEGATEMAEDEMENGSYAGTRELAGGILETHKAELVKMRQLLAGRS
jgi:uncharacterized protein (DUF305 family)